MPFVTECGYRAPFWLPGGDLQTLAPRLFSRVPALSYCREQLELDDGDFLLIDRLFASGCKSSPAPRLVILSHGLEGSSARSYMRAMALAATARGWDVAARNFRGCGGLANRLPKLYHSGETRDLAAVIRWAEGEGYGRIGLVGFSMGGNQTLMYLGKDPDAVAPSICRAVAVSVPCDVAGCSRELSRPRNRMYMEYFLHPLRRKIREKHAQYPDLFPLDGLDRMRTFKEFDDRFTAPRNGFASAEAYWEEASSLPYLGQIRLPVCLVNAANDPFLSESCSPAELAAASSLLHLVRPAQGGHVGFPTPDALHYGWLERTAMDFLTAG